MLELSDINALNDKIRSKSVFASKLLDEISNTVVGQKYVLERMLIGLLSDGHVLLEGLPGLAKTLAVKSMSAAAWRRSGGCTPRRCWPPCAPPTPPPTTARPCPPASSP